MAMRLATGPLSAEAPDDAQDVARRIAAAPTVDALQAQAARIDPIVVRLHADGEPVERIATLVSALNTGLLARLWALLAPPELVAGSCLIVMGSEGRGEQILKTDQDNALLLRDGLDVSGLDAIAQRFSTALAGFGYPPCPGGIMLTNPLWRQPLAGFRESIRGWVYGDDREGPMRLAIFFDAAAVTGDAALLADARDYLDRIFAGQDIYLARFAAAADAFHEPGNWFTRLLTRRDEQPLDLKKLGTFPIVHGVRALCLAQRVRAADTVQRLHALVAQGALDADLGRDLAEALHYLMGLKLRRQLAQHAAGAPQDNLVRPSDLSTMERDQLKDAMAITRRLREHLRQRFKLDAL